MIKELKTISVLETLMLWFSTSYLL